MVPTWVVIYSTETGRSLFYLLNQCKRCGCPVFFYFYIFAPEDNTLKKAITDFCREMIYVLTNGCMNLAASVNVILYDRLAKGDNH